MVRYSITKKGPWIPMTLAVILTGLLIYITYHDLYLAAAALLVPVISLPNFIRSRRGGPDLSIIDHKLVIKALPNNLEYDLSEYYEFKIEKNLFKIKRLVGLKIVDGTEKSDLLVKPIYKDSLETILENLINNRMN